MEKDPPKPKLPAAHRRDYKGKLCIANQMSRVFDDQLPKGDWRRKVATLHQHITDSGEAGFSGRYDPKVLTDVINGIKYEKILEEPTATCDLCQYGDMISPWKRFLYSQYRPGHRFWHEPWRWVRIAWGRSGVKIRP